MKRPNRRTALVAGTVVVLVAVAAWFALLRGEGAEDVSEEYLAAIWEGDWTTECELATDQWRHVLFDGHPFANCADYAKAADKANRDGGFATFREDTEVTITVEEFSSEGDKARVGYVIEFSYDGDDQAGFDELWQGGGPVDRGTVELARVDGEWRIGGVDAG